jgi:hypothetical protein
LRMAEKCWLRSPSPDSLAAYRWRRLWAISEANMLFYSHPPPSPIMLFTYDILETLTSLLGGFVWKARSFAKLSLSTLTFVYPRQTVQGVVVYFIRAHSLLKLMTLLASRLSQ